MIPFIQNTQIVKSIQMASRLVVASHWEDRDMEVMATGPGFHCGSQKCPKVTFT
jgi:hypothetical protein